MTSALLDLEPKEVWKHFEVLAATPRPSTKEAAARSYVLSRAKALSSGVDPRRGRKRSGAQAGAAGT